MNAGESTEQRRQRRKTLIGFRRPLRPLPDDFVFGVATADHQCEAYVAETADIWDVWETQPRQPPLTKRGRASDFWHRYPEDIQLARELGCRAFRFSIAWSRVEPRPGEFDAAAIDHYREVVAVIRAAGMEPIVTLHHFTWPVHLEERGGLIADDFPELFARYAKQVVTQVGEDVRYWITFNEPNQLVYGFIKPCWEPYYFVPPGLPPGATLAEQTDAVATLMRNLFRAHAIARETIKTFYPDALVGANPYLLGLPSWLQRLVDWNATRQRSHDDLMRQGRRFAEGSLLARGDVDVVLATLTVTPERAKQVLFSEVYYVAGQRLLVRAADEAMSPELAGRAVAVVKGSTAERDSRELLPLARPKVFGDYEQARQALERGQVAAMLADDTILRGLIERYPDRYRLIGEPLTREPYAAAVNLGDRELLDNVNAVIRRFKSGGLEPSSRGTDAEVADEGGDAETASSGNRGISGSDIARSAAERLTVGGPLPPAPKGTTLRRIQDRGQLVVAVKGDVPGFGYLNPSTGQYEGLEIDLAREIARQVLGGPDRVEFRPVKTSERIPALRSLLRILDPILKPISVLSTVLSSNWWHLGMAGKLSPMFCPPECVGTQDFVGFDYYWGIPALRLDRIQRLLDAAARRFDRAPVWPGVLKDLIHYHAKLFPGKTIMIVENGSVAAADGVSRATYLERHIKEIQRAAQGGAPVGGYVAWTVTSNREWGLPFNDASDFGLYHIDLDGDAELRRLETEAGRAYRRIIAERGV